MEFSNVNGKVMFESAQATYVVDLSKVLPTMTITFKKAKLEALSEIGDYIEQRLQQPTLDLEWDDDE